MREEDLCKIETHVACICFNEGNVLVLKRSPSREFYPNLWECGGGHVKANESFEEAIVRQMKEEAGVIVDPIGTSDTYVIEKDGKKIPGIKIACRFVDYVDGKGFKISKEHTECKWISMYKINSLETIHGIAKDVKEAYEVLKQRC